MTKHPENNGWGFNKSLSLADVCKIALAVFAIGVFYNQSDANQKKNDDRYTSLVIQREKDSDVSKEDRKETGAQIKDTNTKIEALADKINNTNIELTAVKTEIKSQTDVLKDMRDLMRPQLVPVK